MFLSRRPGLKYVNRNADPVLPDYNESTLTGDSAWHTLDLSAIIPANAKLVELYVYLVGALAPKYFTVNKVGNTNSWSGDSMQTNGVGEDHRGTLKAPVNSSQEISYRSNFDSVNDTLCVQVTGWWI